MKEIYAAWQPAEMHMRTSRRRTAAVLLKKHGVFPAPHDRCLEVGMGIMGWLAELIDWGVPETQLSGIDLDPARVSSAQRSLPAAELVVGDAGALPWADQTFKLVIASTTFTSILDPAVRRRAAEQIVRVMRDDGALLFYDFAFNSPSNVNVRKVEKKELLALFPTLHGEVKKVTLAPPVARLVAPYSWPLATALEALPFLRTHLIAVLLKRGARSV